MDNTYRSETFGIPTGIVSHGGIGENWALKEYERVVNIPIANALHTIQLELIPYNEEWEKGISIPPVLNPPSNCLCMEENFMLESYVEKIIQLNSAAV